MVWKYKQTNKQLLTHCLHSSIYTQHMKWNWNSKSYESLLQFEAWSCNSCDVLKSFRKHNGQRRSVWGREQRQWQDYHSPNHWNWSIKLSFDKIIHFTCTAPNLYFLCNNIFFGSTDCFRKVFIISVLIDCDKWFHYIPLLLQYLRRHGTQDSNKDCQLQICNLSDLSCRCLVPSPFWDQSVGDLVWCMLVTLLVLLVVCEMMILCPRWRLS